MLNTATTASDVPGLVCFLLSCKIPSSRAQLHRVFFSPCESSRVVFEPPSPLLSSSSPYHPPPSPTGHIHFGHSSRSLQFVAPSLTQCSTKTPSTLFHTSTSLSTSLSFTPATHHHYIAHTEVHHQKHQLP